MLFLLMKGLDWYDFFFFFSVSSFASGCRCVGVKYNLVKLKPFKKNKNKISNKVCPKPKCTTAVNLFLAHRYAAVFIILLDRMGTDPRPV